MLFPQEGTEAQGVTAVGNDASPNSLKVDALDALAFEVLLQAT